MRHDARGRGRTFRAVLALPALPAVLAVLAAVAVPLLAGCGGDAGEAGTRNAGTAAGEEAGGEDGGTPGAAAGQPDTVSFHEFGAQMAALDTMLVYCAPGLPGGPRDSCGLSALTEAVTELTGAMTEKIDSAPAPEEYTDAAMAISRLDDAVSDLGRCHAWYARGGTSQDAATDADCFLAWELLTSSWEALKPAVDWP